MQTSVDGMDFDPRLQPIWMALSDAYGQGERAFGAATMQSLLIALGIVIYALLVGKFYLTLSRKEIFHTPHHMLAGEELPPGLLEHAALLLKYTLLFPLAALVWTAFLTVSLTTLSEQPVAMLAIISLACVSATRVLAYLDRKIAEDVAKLLPLVLLAVVLADPGVFAAGALAERLLELPPLAWRLAPAFMALLALEWGLRLGLSFKRMLLPSTESGSGDSELDRLMRHYRPPKEEE